LGQQCTHGPEHAFRESDVRFREINRIVEALGGSRQILHEIGN
jgi:hypothetical protein